MVKVRKTNAKKKESCGIPEFTTADELAALMKTTPRYVRMLEQEKKISREKRGKFETRKTLENLFVFYREKKNSKIGYLEVKTELLKRKLGETDGDLISRELQENWQRSVIGVISNSLDEAPARCAVLFPELPPDIVQARLEKICGDEGIKGKLYKQFKKIAENPNIEESLDTEEVNDGED